MEAKKEEQDLSTLQILGLSFMIFYTTLKRNMTAPSLIAINIDKFHSM